VAGLEGLLFGLLPLSMTDGGTLFRWNKIVWGVLFGIVLFLFWHVLLNKDSKYGAAFTQTNTKVLLVALAFWTLVTVGIYLIFRKPRGVAPHPPMPPGAWPPGALAPPLMWPQPAAPPQQPPQQPPWPAPPAQQPPQEPPPLPQQPR
jgi:hypothetical protein